MNCLEAQQRMTLFLEKRLGEHEVPDFLDHIETCKECREELDLYLAIYMTLHDDAQTEFGTYVSKQTLEKWMIASRKEFRRQKIKKAGGIISIGVIVLGTLIYQYHDVFLELHKDNMKRHRYESMSEAVTEDAFPEEITEAQTDVSESMEEYRGTGETDLN